MRPIAFSPPTICGCASPARAWLWFLALPFFVVWQGAAAASGEVLVQYTFDAAGNVTGIDRSIVAPRPDLTIAAVSVGVITKNADGSRSLPVTYAVTNVGGLAAPAVWYDTAYLSANGALDDADQALAGYASRSGGLAAGASYTTTTTFIAGAAAPAGPYTLFVKVDGSGKAVGYGTNTDVGRIAEANEANNLGGVAITLP